MQYVICAPSCSGLACPRRRGGKPARYATRPNTLRLCGILLLALGIAGCGGNGPKLAPVSGRVTFQGKPLAAGTVRFSNPQGPVDILAKIEADGTYSVRMAQGSGLPEGNYAVAVVPPRVDAPVGTMTLPPPPQYPDIPERYRQPSTSGLTLTVKPGDNPFDIDMQANK